MTRDPPEASSSAATSPIVDNRTRKVGEFLEREIAPGSALSVVSAYFTIYGYGALLPQLDQIGRMRFLYGDPRGVEDVDPTDAEAKAFRLADDGGLELAQALAQKPLAQACSEWIREKVDIRTLRQANLLHGKMYYVDRSEAGSATLTGSSNFTRRGLGLGTTPNIELNLEVRDATERTELLAWFDRLWSDDALTRDAKEDVLEALAKLGRDYAPEFVYYKTLYEVLADRLAKHIEGQQLVGGVRLHDSEIWKYLYAFQRDGAVSAINRLMRHNGCIVADSVGLGKTYTALAVIKYFEAANDRVLVLCPARLKQNWLMYAAHTAQRGNPFLADRFGYTVLAHTDLSRTSGMAGSVDLAQFNWSAFDLIVIDESHNFRNEGRDKRDDEGNLVRRSRYRRLLEEVLKGGVRTKVLMLSATPVNTTLRDLRNQIYLMTGKREDAFRAGLGVGSIQSVFASAQKQFQKWEKERSANGGHDKAALLERLGTDFLAVLDAVTIARSRRHIREHYPEVEKQIGGFPERTTPRNLTPPTDTRGQLSYEDLHDRINQFRMALYMPSTYVTDTSELEKERERLNFDQRDRERWLIGMIRVNLLKRLESSVDSFALTMERIIAKMDEMIGRIERWQARRDNTQFTLDVVQDEDDEDITTGKARSAYRLISLDHERLLADLLQDRANFDAILRRAREVTPDRDAKLIRLREVLADKFAAPSTDKEGRPNRKALVFTTFSDTAKYLYRHLEPWAKRRGAGIALIAGAAGTDASSGGRDFPGLLGRFSPRSQGRIPADAYAGEVEDPIDILIATDCLSEGQNLQDCDLVVNYDIHWNPVRLMQRLGRIDRIGSVSRAIRMVNFWPTPNLEKYLDLKNRVEARMLLADATATGADDPLGLERGGVEKARQGVEQEIAFRDQQLRRIREEALDLEDVDDGVSLSDFTLDDFLADLLNYFKRHEHELREAPPGISAVVPAASSAAARAGDAGPGAVQPGAIFCLQQRNGPAEPTPNRLQPYFLAYVHTDGKVRYSFRHSKQILALFSEAARGHTEPLQLLVAAFDRETDHGRNMKRYDRMVKAAVRNTVAAFTRNARKDLLRSRSGKLPKRSEQPTEALDFDLVTWLVIREEAVGGS
ncbi:MAG: phospholipase D-like domain-containing protein [Gemmatimonadetes bacterium]|nr:phospholipase D-like domain-containing protein [Gemmatimonadota bacterium]MCY3943907.1 phospholipase D-like domain-containing protein [Gemmatimonadota bacterium]